MRSKYFKVVLVSFIASVGLLVIFVVLAKNTPVSTSTVTFINSSNIPTSLYQSTNSGGDEHPHNNPKKITDINQTRDVALANGRYCLSINSNDYAKEDICVEVKGKPTSVTIDPNFSKNYLTELLPKEQPSVRTLIKNTYKEIIAGFTISDDRLFMKGQWYGLSLTQRVPDPSDRGDVYLLVLEKVGGKWTIKDIPKLSVNKYQLPDVPIPVLDEVNRMPGSH